MRAFGPGGRVRAPGRRLGFSGLVFAAAFLFMASGGRDRQEGSSDSVTPEGRWTGKYGISAHVFLLGNLGYVGSMTIESAAGRNDGRLTKSLRVAGRSSPAQIRKKRDYSGEFNVLKVYPLRPDESVDEEAVGEWGEVESSSSGFLKLNQKFESEKIDFFRDHALSIRHDGSETRIEGSFGSILSPLEYLMEHDIQVGEVIETPFILNGIPRVFRLEVAKLTNLSPWNSPAYEIKIYAIEITAGVDRAPEDVWRKKGNLQIWFCKDGSYRNRVLRIRIKFRWYLWLRFDLQKSLTG